MTQAFNLAQLANNLNTSGQLDGTDGLSGTVPIANGGTGRSTLTANNVLLGNGTSSVNFVAPGTSGNVLTSNGSTWTSATVPAIGVGQTYVTYSVGTERQFGTTYTNSTSKPILVIFSSPNAGATAGSVYVNDVEIQRYNYDNSVIGINMTWIVMPGATYRMTINSASFNTPLWVELR
jgi:hypothetical protein